MPSTPEYQKEIRKRWKAAGLCSMCGVRPVDRKNRLTCEDCAIRYSTYLRRLKKRALDGYGHKCACCGEIRFEFLSFDHVENDGAKERREKGKKMNSGSLYRLIIKEGFPKRYQILCYNCNMALAFFGFCPHHPEIRRIVAR